MMPPERTPAQRAMDDELAYLRQCGLLPDPRDEQEWESYYQRYYDRDPFARSTSSVRANTPTGTHAPHAPAGGGTTSATEGQGPDQRPAPNHRPRGNHWSGQTSKRAA